MPSTTYIVQPGDCMSSIANDNGFKDWTSIYNHPDNASLKQNRPDPNILAPGDKVMIPDKDPHSETRQTGSRYTFKVTTEDVMLKIYLKNDNGDAFKNKKCKLTIDGKDFDGSTDGSGLLKQSVPPSASGGILKIFLDGGPNDPGTVFPLDLGGLDPVNTDSGVNQRLQNLGYDFDPDDSDSLANAISAFQQDNNLNQTGDLDDTTRNKLKTAHDGS